MHAPSTMNARFRRARWALVAMLCSLAACGGDDGGGGGDAGGNGSSDGGGSDGGGNGSAPPPGPPADGWEQDYGEDGARIGCGDDRAAMTAAGAAHLVFGDTAIFVGYEQVGDNQNPIVARFDGEAQVYCQKHETEGPDGRAVGITWDGGDTAYVVYTIVGGGSALENRGGWVPSYAPGSISGGGPRVSYVGRVAVTDGSLTSGTFVIAVKSDNKVNSHGPRGPVTVLEDGRVEFLGESAHKPIDQDWKPMDCTDYPFDSRYRFSADLATLDCADCTSCVSATPCE